MTTFVQRALSAIALAVSVSMAAAASHATIITYDSSPVGGPPVGADAFNAATNPVTTNGTIVDLGGGNHAVSLPTLSGAVPNEALFFRFRTLQDIPNPGFIWHSSIQYDWQLNSFDVFVAQDTTYRLNGFGGNTGVLPAGQWTTIIPVPGFFTAQFISPVNGFTVLIDNVNYTSLGSHVVPEPSTWMMLIGGFAMIGAALRRRRISATA